ncbi:hypothetical protein F5B21DRAFT_502707 [Xylaria acuta]|nr:hypothetical protein F5B21DRAFT_502707 [Xylaria acuta]
MEGSRQKQASDGVSGPADTVSQPKNTKVCFEYFSKLPPEIRLMIWELAIPARILNLWNLNNVPKHLFFAPWYKAPPVAHACHDSRHLARRTGSISTFGTPMTGPRMPRLSISWFDSHRDTLRIYSNTVIEYIPRSVENIAFCWPTLLYDNLGTDMKFAILPKLRRVQFELDWRFVPSEIWNTWEFSQGRERVGSMLLDIDDEAEVQRFANTLRHRSEWQYSYWFQEIGHLRDEKFLRSETDEGEDWKVVQKQLQERWIEDRKEDIELATDHSESESCYAKMPEFRRVLSLVPFPEELYEDGASYHGKEYFMLFDIMKKPERRVLKLKGRETVQGIECFKKLAGGLLPDYYIRPVNRPTA